MIPNDMSGHVATHPDHVGVRHTLTVREVEAMLVAAGIVRSHRHVLRMCKSGMLDALKIPGGPSGEEWYVTPDSVPRAIGDLKQIEEQRARRVAAQPAIPDHVAPAEPLNQDTDMSGHVAPQPAASVTENKDGIGTTRHDMPRHTATKSDLSQDVGAGESTTSRYVALLERDNEFLREQVAKKDNHLEDLSKRFGETQFLLGAMQKMLAPLLGQSDPFARTPPSDQKR